jgi:hypothetical protein
MIALVIACLLGSLSAAAANQNQTVIKPGYMAVTGFSGTHVPRVEEGFPPNVDPLDETFIDPSRATLRVFDISDLGGPAAGQLVHVPKPFEVTAGQIGQVFGLAFDDGRSVDGLAPAGSTPNLYVTASSLHGIQIVKPDADNDGRPERLKKGALGARFMDGQFGPNDAGPGAIWKIDGVTGAVSLFARIATNSGAALGNIAFDPRSRQFFVSDVDTGLVHRITMAGNVVDSFDHGVTGHQLAGLAPVADDGATMNITSGSFATENPETWGYTQDARRVWGVGVLRGRLYYAVGSSAAKIWSVGIGRDGSFLDDAHWEIDVAGTPGFAVTDIAFDGKGVMYLAQRGPVQNRYDYSSFAGSGRGEVLRYFLKKSVDPTKPDVWTGPDSYATGWPAKHQQSAGGVDLQYGYGDDGRIDFDKCDTTVLATGDDLLGGSSPAGGGLVTPAAQSAPVVVHGVQLTEKVMVRPSNQPPARSWFFDFDAFFEDSGITGHVGDVEVWRPCEGRPGNGRWSWRQTRITTFPGADVCLKPEEVVFECDPNGELIADIYFGPSGVPGANTLRAQLGTPGLTLWPGRQTRSTGRHPFSFWLGSTLPGDRIRLDLCLFDASVGEQPGIAYPCCRGSIEIQAPDFMCR